MKEGGSQIQSNLFHLCSFDNWVGFLQVSSCHCFVVERARVLVRVSMHRTEHVVAPALKPEQAHLLIARPASRCICLNLLLLSALLRRRRRCVWNGGCWCGCGGGGGRGRGRCGCRCWCLRRFWLCFDIWYNSFWLS
jgi:hypothetical protein